MLRDWILQKADFIPVINDPWILILRNFLVRINMRKEEERAHAAKYEWGGSWRGHRVELYGEYNSWKDPQQPPMAPLQQNRT